MAIRAENLPPGTDGQAHLFFDGSEVPQFMVVSTTGCIAVQLPDTSVRVLHWYYRSKGKELITLPHVPWAVVWSCRAPWNAEPCGHLTRLQVDRCGLSSLHVRGLTRVIYLSCAGNKLESLDLSGLKSLKSIDCSGNELAAVEVNGCAHLTRLRVGGNPRIRESASQLLALARGEPPVVRRPRLTSTSLFDL